jgi:replicative DNA helicase
MTPEQKAKVWSPEAEQSVLGALLTYGREAFELVQPIGQDHFFDGLHRTVFRSIEGMHLQRLAVDVIAVWDSLKADQREAVGLEYLNSLSHACYGLNNVARHAGIVREKAKRRELIAAAERSIKLAVEEGDIGEQIDRITTVFSAIQRQTMKQAPVSLADIALRRTEHYEALQAGSVQAGWPTNIAGLTSMLSGGLRPGGLYILAARPAVGKSSFAQSLGWAMAKNGKRTLFLSQEMPADELGDRALASVGRVDFGHILTGRINDDEWGRVSEAAEELVQHRDDFFVDDQGGLTLTDVRSKAKQIPGLSVLILDYLQLCSGSLDKGANRNAEIEQISRGLKTFAKEFGVAVVVLSQLNREVEKRVDKKPTLADLRDCGAIEQDADVVMFLWPARELSGGAKLVGLSLGKNRQGRCGDVALHFDGAMQRWGESTEPLFQDRPSAPPRARLEP